MMASKLIFFLRLFTHWLFVHLSSGYLLSIIPLRELSTNEVFNIQSQDISATPSSGRMRRARVERNLPESWCNNFHAGGCHFQATVFRRCS